jgi:hypothetical protein
VPQPDAPDFTALFASCREAIQVEGRPEYADPAEQAALARYRRTGQIVAPASDWPQTVETATDAGTVVGRLRLVSSPLTEYESWELGVFARYPTAEKIRVLPRRRLPYRHDVWIFDRTRALWMTYDQTGAFTRAETGPAGGDCQYWIRRYEEASVTPAQHLTAAPSHQPITLHRLRRPAPTDQPDRPVTTPGVSCREDWT